MTDRTLRTALDLDALALEGPDTLLPVVATDARTGEALMLAWANREALERTLATGEVHFWSRSRQALWRKGETSGNVLRLVSLHADCDGDALLARVHPTGPVCHTGERTCFGDGVAPPPGGAFQRLAQIIDERAAVRSTGSWTSRLLEDENLRIKKLGEETAELVAALARGDAGRIPEEAADLVYHLLVALRGAGVSLADVEAVLEGRARPSS